MGIQQITQMGPDALTGRRHPWRLGHIGPGLLENQAKNINLGDRLLEFSEVLKDIVRYSRRQRGRKDGPTDNIRGQVAHGHVQGKANLCICLLLQKLQVCLYGRLHRRKGMADSQLGKCGINHGALALPAFTIGDKDGLPNQGFQCVHHQIALGESTAVIPKDVPHQIRSVEQHSRAAGITEVAEVKAIGGRRQQFQQVAVTVPQHSRQGRQRRQRSGMGRVQQGIVVHGFTPAGAMAQYGGAL